MTPSQRKALDALEYGSPGPAERARLKRVLGWRRTREETVALARELVDAGMVPAAVAAQLDIGPRHLRRVLAEVEPPENGGRNLSVQAEKADTIDAPKGSGHLGARNGARGPSPGRFATFDELDRWLEVRA